MTDPKDDWLETMMNSDEYIEDAGFTARVSAALPPPRHIRNFRRNAIVVGSAVLGAFLSLFVLPGSKVLVQAYVELSALIEPSTVTTRPLVALAILAMGLVGVFASVRSASI